MDTQKNSPNNKRRKVILKINGTKINQSRTSYSSRQRYLDMSEQKYKPFVVRLGTKDKFANIQIPPPQENDDEQDSGSSGAENYRQYFKIQKDLDRLTPKEFQKKYVWGGTRNPTQVKTEKARVAVISRRLRTNYDNYAYLHDVLDISTVSISGDPKLKELNLFCTEDLKKALNTPLKKLPELKGNTNHTVVTLISRLLADIQSANNSRIQNSSSDDDDRHEDYSEDDQPHSWEDGNDNIFDHDVIMEEDEGEPINSSTVRLGSQQQQQINYVSFNSAAWKAKLSKLKEKV